jgi:hydrogenase assembly chaperone HypC/HupF
MTGECDHTIGCITCGDEAVPMRVVRVDERRGLALCANGEARQTVETELVGAVAAGDALLVHAGTALMLLDGPMAPDEERQWENAAPEGAPR